MGRKKKAAAGSSQSMARLPPDFWTSEEQAILEHGLKKYPLESRSNYCCQIANDLPKKDTRAVALRIKWMTDNKKGPFTGPSPTTVDINNAETERLLEKNSLELKRMHANMRGGYEELQREENKNSIFNARQNIVDIKKRIRKMPGGEKLMNELVKMVDLDDEKLCTIFSVKFSHN